MTAGSWLATSEDEYQGKIRLTEDLLWGWREGDNKKGQKDLQNRPIRGSDESKQLREQREPMSVGYRDAQQLKREEKWRDTASLHIPRSLQFFGVILNFGLCRGNTRSIELYTQWINKDNIQGVPKLCQEKREHNCATLALT